MQIDISNKSWEMLQRRIENDPGVSAERTIEDALAFYETYGPSMESLKEKLRAAHRSYEAGHVREIDPGEIKQRGRERMAEN